MQKSFSDFYDFVIHNTKLVHYWPGAMVVPRDSDLVNCYVVLHGELERWGEDDTYWIPETIAVSF